MLEKLFPKQHHYYSSLPILGSILNEFAEFLFHLGYSRQIICRHVRSASFIDHQLQQQGCQDIEEINKRNLRSCAPSRKTKKNIYAPATIKVLNRYFKEKRTPLQEPLNPSNPIEAKLLDYCDYLQKVRGITTLTVQKHYRTSLQFLTYFNKHRGISHLSKITLHDIEGFVCDTGKKVGREELRHVISYLRSLLRFLVIRGEVPTGLDSQIDTPRIYREEKLPHFLEWETVEALMKSIDRKSAIGKRDYAMLLLIVTYGLRVGEVIHLKLEDIDWRNNILRICQHKTKNFLLLPLTNAVGKSIMVYLRQGRPSVSSREVFIRHQTPKSALGKTAVSTVFRKWVHHSGLSIPFHGAHCLRHSFAIHLLRQHTSLKIIGDILGHRSFESTCVYLRLSLEDLRTVPLNLPIRSKSDKKGAVK